MTTPLFAAALVATAISAAPQATLPPAPTATPPAARREVARVNGTPILSDRLDVAVNALIPLSSFHRNVSAETMASLRASALQTLIDEELTYQEGIRHHVVVPDAEFDAAWADAAAAYGGAAGLRATLGRAGLSEAAARAELRRVLTIRRTSDRFVTATCGVSLDDARQFFDANPDRFLEPEQLHVYGITVGVDPSRPDDWATARARADLARQALRAGTPFAEVARAYSTDPSSRDHGGDLGVVHRGSLNPTFESIAKDLGVGQDSDVVETLYGYHIIRIVGIAPARQRSFDDVAAKLQQELTTSRCDTRKQTWLADLRARADVTVVEP